MAKAVLICYNKKYYNYSSSIQKEIKKIKSVLSRISPDNILPNPPFVSFENGLGLGVLNPSSLIKKTNFSVCLGQIFGDTNDWDIPKSLQPDGSFSIFRSNKTFVELLTDSVASRTIWYIKTEKMFIASNSQRAIVMLLGDFQPKRRTFSWMLSSGSLGPSNSWDKRIVYVPGNSRAVLDRSKWQLIITQNDVVFTSADLPYEEYKFRLRSACEETINKLKLDWSQWVLSLSGGYDSRAILLLLGNNDIRSINWGLKSSLINGSNDTNIPKMLAQHLGMKFEFFENKLTDEPIDNIFQRFLTLGEGRVDHIGGYIDGFKMYKKLFDRGECGIVRGDEAFGWNRVLNSFQVRKSVGLLTLSDYSNLSSLNEFGIIDQELPYQYLREKGESLATWRDRLYREFRLPVILAALNDLKTSYLEIINPFLSKNILDAVSQTPDQLRTDKVLFKQIVHDMSPSIPFTNIDSSANLIEILNMSMVNNLFKDELRSEYVKTILSTNLINYLLKDINLSNQEIKSNSFRKSLMNWTKSMVPTKIKRYSKQFIKNSNPIIMNHNLLLFRAFIICKMCQILQDDVSAMKKVTYQKL